MGTDDGVEGSTNESVWNMPSRRGAPVRPRASP